MSDKPVPLAVDVAVRSARCTRPVARGTGFLFFSSYQRDQSDMEYSQLSNLELLELAIGMRGARRLYRGTLEPLFVPDRQPNRYHRKLAAVKELHKRWLRETLTDKEALSSPSAVRDYLRVFFAGQGHES